jgi:Fe-S cluster assembly protein SufD
MSLAAFIDRSRKDRESWRYTDLEKLLSARSKSGSTPLPAPSNLNAPDSTDDAPRLVFVNGVFQAKQSRFGSIPSCILMGDADTGYKLTLGEHTCLVVQPVELVFTTDAKSPADIAVKLAIEIGDNGRLTLLELHPASSAVTAVEMEITLHPRAKFVHGKIVSGGAHLARSTVRVADGAYYNNFALLHGTQPARNEIAVTLAGEEAHAVMNGAMLLRGTDHADTVLHVTHAAPNCSSRQIYRSVLDGKAHGVFQGKILVAKGAQKTDGYQLSRALLLSDQAEIDAKPELEIYADDVKCSHGSTVGELDEDALFYLRARGLSEIEARALLIEGFVAELFDEIQVEAWRDRFRALTLGWLKGERS